MLDHITSAIVDHEPRAGSARLDAEALRVTTLARVILMATAKGRVIDCRRSSFQVKGIR